MSLQEIIDAGAQRVSVGGALTFVAAGALATGAARLLKEGDLSTLLVPADAKDWIAAALTEK
jgi:hypothetical protein